MGENTRKEVAERISKKKEQSACGSPETNQRRRWAWDNGAATGAAVRPHHTNGCLVGVSLPSSYVSPSPPPNHTWPMDD